MVLLISSLGFGSIDVSPEETMDVLASRGEPPSQKLVLITVSSDKGARREGISPGAIPRAQEGMHRLRPGVRQAGKEPGKFGVG